MLRLSLTLIIIAVATYGLCALVARRRLLLDPVSERSNHARPVSRAAGLCIAAILFVWAAVEYVLTGLGEEALRLLALSAAAGAIGAVDDLRSLPASAKLVLLAGLSVAASLLTGGVQALPAGPEWLPLPVGLGVALGAVWVFGFVNVFNFLDGLNGMAAGTGALLLVGLALLSGETESVLFLAAAAAVAGFGVRNVAGGAPFLGDAGSLGLGTLIAAGALATASTETPFPLYVVAAAAMPFVADAVLTMARRARAGADVMSAHSEHAYQRLHRAGYRHATVSLVYALLAGVVLAAGLATRVANSAWFALALAAGGFLLWRGTVWAMFRLRPQAERTKEDSASPSSVSRKGEGGKTDKADAACSA